ncbi:prepilin peptidase [Camelliibacillus cellulosilyticus]|uniref:Prepilin peptidase n=1 Tax=Camelliibacillus cellulosilyticus TaxID=2174486 RepID=A0ABV9GTD4_9BACL
MTLFYIFVCILGAVLGSFYNVIGLRVPEQVSIVRPPSHCPNCKRRLKAGELIPVFSYVFLGGKCRACQTKISPLYPAVELAAACLFTYAAIRFGFTPALLPTLALISLLLIVFVSDISYMLIPDKIVLFFAALFVILRIFIPYVPWLDGIIGAAVGFGALYFAAVVSRGSMGGGDIKLFAVLGFVLGYKGVLLAFFFSCLYGTLIGGVGMIIGKVKKGIPIPFAPFIGLGALTAYFFGEKLLYWYFHLL